MIDDDDSGHKFFLFRRFVIGSYKPSISGMPPNQVHQSISRSMKKALLLLRCCLHENDDDYDGEVAVVVGLRIIIRWACVLLVESLD